MSELGRLSDWDLISCAILFEKGEDELGINRLLTYAPDFVNEERAKIRRKNFMELLDFLYPTIYNNCLKRERVMFSLPEMTRFINLSWYRMVKDTTLKSWVSNGDYKRFIGTPSMGKKYSLLQIQKILLIHDLKQIIDDDKIGNYLSMINCVENTISQWMPVYLQVSEMYYYTTLILKNNAFSKTEYEPTNYKENKENINWLRNVQKKVIESNNSQLINLYNDAVKNIENHRYLTLMLDRLKKNNIEKEKSNEIVYRVEIRKLSDWIFEFDVNIPLNQYSLNQFKKIKEHCYSKLSNLPNHETLTNLLPILETGNYINILKSTILKSGDNKTEQML